eukprot:jgi/Bigna1/87503/estExt_fgenesh1_pg.C_210059
MAAEGWALAQDLRENQVRRQQLQPPSSPSSYSGSKVVDDAALTFVKSIQETYRKAKPCAQTLVELCEGTRRLRASGENLRVRLISGTKKENLGALASFKDITRLLTAKHVQEMEKILRALRSDLSKIALLMEEMGRFSAMCRQVLQEAKSALPSNVVCLATSKSPSIAELVQWMEILCNMLQKEMGLSRNALESLGNYDEKEELPPSSLSKEKAGKESNGVSPSKWMKKMYRECFGRVPSHIHPSLLK